MVLRAMRNRIAKGLLLTSIPIGDARECPICGWRGLQFQPTGIQLKYRYDAKCPRCGSFERHRLAYLLLRDELERQRPNTLHVAPEASIEPWLRRISSNYLSMDLRRSAMVQGDITAMTFAEDGQFSLVWCSHVLEHIEDDIRAMSEMFRVCQPGGRAVIQVPIWRQTTYEDSSITTREDRLAHFYQGDHVRLYGYDIVGRLESVGFQVEVRRAQELKPALTTRHAVSFLSTNEVFVCTRPHSPAA
jgi:predicted SAM-dependent methyltransferase